MFLKKASLYKLLSIWLTDIKSRTATKAIFYAAFFFSKRNNQYNSNSVEEEKNKKNKTNSRPNRNSDNSK